MAGRKTQPEWDKVFEKALPDPGASDADIEYLNTRTLAPLIEPTPNEAAWRIPKRPFPTSYVDFLRWSNGGCFTNGDRTFDAFFTVSEVREMMLGYEVPEYMEGAVPFAFDGGGHFYLFDMRSDAVDDEYTIVFTHAGNLGWDDAVTVGDTFPEACRGRVDPVTLPYPTT